MFLVDTLRLCCFLLLFFFFFSSQIAVILSRLYDMSRVLVARRETMQVTLCEGRPGKDRYDSLGSWQKHVPGLFL